MRCDKENRWEVGEEWEDIKGQRGEKGKRRWEGKRERDLGFLGEEGVDDEGKPHQLWPLKPDLVLAATMVFLENKRWALRIFVSLWPLRSAVNHPLIEWLILRGWKKRLVLNVLDERDDATWKAAGGEEACKRRKIVEGNTISISRIIGISWFERRHGYEARRVSGRPHNTYPVEESVVANEKKKCTRDSFEKLKMVRAYLETKCNGFDVEWLKCCPNYVILVLLVTSSTL
ncbi:hypothetical protein Syun_029441 [Stephania yunnanensis]|uniref:Uncharacterized protein n=1 Tax=Stephania yunnanensis TaxID=152371 RepID=A0AAP0E9Z2_9MAGN